MVQQTTSGLNAQRPSGSRFVRLFLIALLWQGPIPVIHSHASFKDERELAAHLKCCHFGDERTPGEIVQLGGHMHFMPVRSAGDQGTEDPSSPVRAPGSSVLASTAGVTAADALGLCELASESLWTHVPLTAGGLVMRRPEACAAFSFWDHFASHLSLPVRLGVLRS